MNLTDIRARRDAKKQDANAKAAAQSLSNAQLIYNVLRTEPTPRDAAATISAVLSAMVWNVEQVDEEKARELSAELTQGVMELWKAQKKAHDAAQSQSDIRSDA